MHANTTHWRLDAATATALIAATPYGPELQYFGPLLDSGSRDADALTDDSVLHASLDDAFARTLCPQASLGYCGSPGLAGHRDGSDFAHRWTLSQVDPDDTGNGLTFTLTDPQADLRLCITVSLDPDTAIMTVQPSLTNTGDSVFTVDWLASATVPLPDHHTEILSQHGRWGGEFREYRRPIAPGLTDISNRHGRTSHEHNPWLMTGAQGFAEQHDDVLCVHLAWSGNASLRVERLVDSQGTVQVGVLPLPGEWRIAAGDTLTPPAALIARAAGINAVTQAFHAHARQRILPAWTRERRPIHANSWEAVYFDHATDTLTDLIDACATLGAERFVLDDGWFGRRRSDHAGLGDWFVDPEVYPEGLHTVVERVRSHGMQFGLWFEPEMVNPDSALYEDHPEWTLRLDGIETPLARQQLVLDLSLDDVQSYLHERIVSLVHEYAIDYIKWDMNRDLVLAGDGQGARAARQPDALYRLLQDIQRACPTLEIESCSSGGARVDYGVLAHTGRVWASDSIDPVERARIQAGFLRLYPPEVMGAHVGHKAAHLTGRETSLHTRAIMALQGQYGFEIDARRLDTGERDALAHYTGLYKTHRSWLSESRYHRLNGFDESLVASLQVSDDRQQALLTVMAVAAHPHSRPGRLRLAGLHSDTNYRVSLASNNRDELASFSRQLPRWLRKECLVSGALLMQLGLPLPVLAPQLAMLVHCVAEAQP